MKTLTPTMELRFVEKYFPENLKSSIKICMGPVKVLQQNFEVQELTMRDGKPILEHTREWRDVPLEIE